MQTHNSMPPGAQTQRLHPLIMAAAVSVIVLSAVGVAAIVGWLPGSSADEAPLHEAVVQAAQSQQPDQASAPAAPAAPAAAAAKPAQAVVQAAPKPSAAVPAPTPKPAAAGSTACTGCGVVESVRAVQGPAPRSGNFITDNNVIGTVAGGVVGGVVGNQFGGGSGKTALTVLGAMGGALAGHEIERNIRTQPTVTHYELTVRMNDGSARVFRSAQPFAYASGDRVRVDNDQLLPR